MITKKSPKNAKNFECNLCNYICSKKSEWNRHINTRKHKLLTNTDEKTPLTHICECGKSYKHRQSLYTHKKKCKYDKKVENTEEETEEKNIDYKEMFLEMVNQNKEMLNQNNELQKTIHEMIPNIGNNNNNKNFNINVFLNENCKDAVNLMDFVNGLQFKMEDVEDLGKLGFVEGTSKIFINGLKELEYTKRPVHCSDIKQETLYIKDNNMWKQDTDNNDKMKQAIDEITKANMDNIPQWIRDNPTFGSDDQCMRIISNIMKIQEGMNNDEKKQIINNIAKETLIDK